MKHINFEVSDKIYFQFAAQVNMRFDNGISIPVLDQVENQVWNKVWNEVWNEIEISP